MQPRTPIERPLASTSGSIAWTSAANLRPGSASMSTHAFWPLLQLGLQPLGQAEVDVDGVHVLDVDDVGPVLEVVADADVADAGDAVERRQDAQPRRGGPRQGQLGLGDLEVGRALVDRTLADEVLRHQFLVALVVGLRDRQLGLGLLHLGQLQLVVELHQELAAPHPVAVAEVELRHPPADLGAQHHALARPQAAHGLGFIGELDHLDPGHLHRGRPGWTGRRPRRRPGLHLGRPGRPGRAVLVPPRRPGGGRDADHGDHGVDCFRCHER